MKKKVLVLEMESGDTYHVPAHIIADNRAKHIAEIDPDATYKEEYDFTMKDEYLLKDWYFNNMNPEDVAEEAVLVEISNHHSFEDEEVEDSYVEEV